MNDNSEHEKDKQLMLRIIKRDIDAYQQLVAKYINRCTRFAERMVGEHSDAKDVVQDVCIKLWNEPQAWQPTARFSTWFYRVLFNACIDHKRKQKPTGSELELDALEDDALNQEQAIIAREKKERVRGAMQQLPERQRAALVLCYYEELSNQHAAEVLGVTVGALEQMLFRARQTMKDLLLPAEMEKAHG